MKFVKLLLGNIKRMAKGHTLMLFLMIMGLIVSCCSFCIYYMMSSALSNAYTASNGLDRCVDIRVEGIKDPESYGKILEFAKLAEDDLDQVSVICESNEDYDIIGLYSQDIRSVGSILAGEDITAAGQVLIPSELVQGELADALGDDFSIGENSYTIQGIYSKSVYAAEFYSSLRISKESYAAAGVAMSDELYAKASRDVAGVYMTFEDFVKGGYEGSILRIRFYTPLSSEAAADLGEALTTYIMQSTGDMVSLEQTAVESGKEVTSIGFTSQFIMYITISVLSLINTVMLFVFVLRKNAKQYRLCRIMGATNGRLTAVICAEMFIYLVIAFTIGWFVKDLIINNSDYKAMLPVVGADTYFLLLGAVTAFVLGNVLIMTRQILRKEIKESEKEAAIPVAELMLHGFKQKRLYLLFKSYSGKIFSEIIIFLLIFFVGFSFTYAGTYIYERGSMTRFSEKYLNPDKNLYFSISPEYYVNFPSWQEKGYQPAVDLFKKLDSVQGARIGRMLINEIFLYTTNTPQNATESDWFICPYELNDVLIDNVSLPLKQGVWLDEWSEGIDYLTAEYIPCVVATDFAALHGLKVGDEFQMYLQKVIGYKEDKEQGGFYLEYDWLPVTMKVVGLIGNDTRTLGLSGLPARFDMSFPSYDSAIAPYTMYTPVIYEGDQPYHTQGQTTDAILVTDGTVSAEDLQQQLEGYGDVLSIETLAENSDALYGEGTNQYLIHAIIATALLFVGIAGYNLLSLERQKRAYGIYFACGMPWKKAIVTSMTANGVIFLLGGIAGSLWGVYSANSNRIMMADTKLYSVLTAIGFILILFVISSISMLVKMLKTSPVSLIKKGD